MQQERQPPKKSILSPQSVTGITLFAVASFGLFAIATWDTLVYVGPVIIYAFGGLALVAALVATLSFCTWRVKWLDVKLAELGRDKTLATNAGRQAGIETDRQQMRLMAEGRLMAETINQVKRGLIHAGQLGEGRFSAFPAQIINKVEQGAVPLLEAPQPVLPDRIELGQVVPRTGPSINALALGIEIAGLELKPLVAPLPNLVHIGVGGSSGWGKSVFLQCLALQIALAPELAQMALIDVESQTFPPFAASNKLRYPLADNERDILAILGDLRGEWSRRRQLYQQYPQAPDLGSYNRLAPSPIPPIILMVDEINMLTDNDEIMGQLTRLGQGTRKYGIYCVLGGQNWNATSIPTRLRDNFSTRIQLKAMSKSQSRIMLEDSSAADIQKPGRAYAVLPGKDLREIQTPIISMEDIINALGGVSRQQPPVMPTFVMAPDETEKAVIEAAKTATRMSGPSDDELAIIEAAKKIKSERGKIVWSAVTGELGWTTGGPNNDRIKAVLDKWAIEY